MAIDPNIKKKANDIRNKVYGKEVRESLASGLEEMSSDVVETVGRQDEVEGQWQNVVDETTGKDVISAPEIIAARDGEANLKARLDKENQEVTAQLAQNAKQTMYDTNMPLSLSNVEITDGDWRYPVWLNDKDEIYWIGSNHLLKSDSYEDTMTTIFNFDRSISFVRELEDGELLVGTRQTATEGGQIFKSNNNHTNWTMVLQLQPNSFIQPGWGIYDYGSLVLLGEYGGHGSATKVYMSNNYGASFSEILNLDDYVVIPSGSHVHSVAYDRWFDRIWVVHGDGNPDSGNTGVLYSDDRGVTWTFVKVPTQMLTVHPFRDRVVFTSDAAPDGIYTYERKFKNETPEISLVYPIDNQPLLSNIPYMTYQKNEKSPLIITWREMDNRYENPKRYIIATRNGKDFTEIWRDDIPKEPGESIFYAVGPTNDNKIIAGFNLGNRGWSATKLVGDYNEKTNSSTTFKKTYRQEIDIRDLGAKGDGSDESWVWKYAIEHCAKIGANLVVPPNFTITIRNAVIKNINNISLKVLGEIKLVDLASGGSGTTLAFENCHNIQIPFIQFDGNFANQGGEKIGALKTMLSFKGCSNIIVGEVITRDLVGRAVTIEDSQDIEIDLVLHDSKELGYDIVFIRDSRDAHIKKIKGHMGDVISYDSRSIFITSRPNKITSNIKIDTVDLVFTGREAICIDTDSTGIIENITINNVDIRLGDSFSHVDSSLIVANNVKELKIQGKITGKNNLSRPCRINRASKAQIDLKVNGFNEGVQIGNIGLVSDSFFKLNYNDINKSSLLLGQVKNIVFDRLYFGENISSDLTSPYITSSGDVNWDNLYFDGGSARKDSTDSTDSISFLMVYNQNIKKVKFKNFDLDDWRNESPNLVFQGNAGTDILKVNCLGYNHREDTPNSPYTIAKKGEVIYNTNPQADGYLGWVCIGETPTPTWKEFGKIEV